MPEEGPVDRLIKFGERVRGMLNPNPKPRPEPISEEKRRATEKAIGPRYRSTVNYPSTPPAPPKVAPKRKKRAASKY